MVRTAIVVVASSMIIASLSCQRPAAAPVPAAAAPSAEVQRDNDESVRAVLAQIAGREQEQAGAVFTNVKYLADVPARTFLTIMDIGYAKALGVRCSHCHVTTDYGSDEKRSKRAAREMQVMHRMINQQLAAMEHIKTPVTANRSINCMTCHQGKIDPR